MTNFVLYNEHVLYKQLNNYTVQLTYIYIVYKIKM